VRAGAARCAAAVLIGPDRTDAARLLSGLPILRAASVQDAAIAQLRGVPVLAFAGLAYPGKFFAALAEEGAVLAGTAPFPDHHRYAARELRTLAARATALGARLVTTPKDAVRLPAAFRATVTVMGVNLVWEDPAAIDGLLRRLLASNNAGPEEAG
jgi:tetraacyldisaccharide 4'-kinase